MATPIIAFTMSWLTTPQQQPIMVYYHTTIIAFVLLKKKKTTTKLNGYTNNNFQFATAPYK
jgi:hypothetical protein